MAQIPYNILDDDLVALFGWMGIDYETLAGQPAIQSSLYDAAYDTILAELENLAEDDPLYDEMWGYFDNIDTEIWIWSTEKEAWDK